MHLQLVIRMAAIHHARHEGALGASVLVPRQRHDHPGIIMPNPHLAGVTVHPQGPGTGAEAEGTHQTRLRRLQKARVLNPALHPLGHFLVIARADCLVVEQ